MLRRSFTNIRPSRHQLRAWACNELEPRLMLAGDAGVAVAATVDIASVPHLTSADGGHLVFIDAAVAADPMMLSAVPADAELVLLDADADGIEQITTALRLKSNLKSVQLITHGSDGSIQLGNTILDGEKLQEVRDQVAVWGNAIGEHGDLLLYGCEVAKSRDGQQFVRQLGKIAKVDVAASEDRTGRIAANQSDWQLEFAIGIIEHDDLLVASSLAQFKGQLPITIFAAGSTGDELMELEVNGEIVDTWFVNGTDAEADRFFPYTVNLDGVSVDDIRINFVNDLYDPSAGIDRNLRVDRIEVDGISYEAEDPSVFAEGVFIDGQGIRSGNFQTEFLSSDGYFQFSSSGGGNNNPNGSTIEVALSGATGEENAELLIDGVVVEQFNNVSQSGQIFTFQADQDIAANRISVGFTNDLFTPSLDRNLNVDFIRVDGETFQTEAATTFSTGTWLAADGVQPGFRQSETLHSNGVFEYLADEPVLGGPNSGSIALGSGGINVNETAGSFTLDIIREGGSDGVVSVDYFTANDTAVAGQDYQAASGTVTFGDGETRRTITININDDNNDEGTETFSVRLDNANGAPLFAPRTATIRILDNDSDLPSFPSFTNANNLSLNGNANVTGGSLQLTAATPQQRGSSYFTTPISIDPSTSFQTQFSSRFTGGQGSAGGEGLAFVIQNSPAGVAAQNLGNFAGGLNYNAVPNSIAVELDTFRNSYEAFADEITIVANGVPVTPLANIPSPFDLNNGQTYYTWIDYNGDSNVLAVFISDENIKPNFAAIRTTVDLAATVGDQAYIGFAAATGTAFNNTFIDSWNFTFDTPDPDPPTFPTGSPVEVNLASGLDNPVSIKFGDNFRNIYVAEKAGVLKVVRDGGNVQTVLDISDRVNSFQDRGLIGLEVDPNFESNGYIYLSYTYDPPEVFDNVGNAFAGPDGQGNRAGQVIRVTADAATGFTSIVNGSERILVGSQSTWNNFNAFIDSTLNISAPQSGINPDGSYINDFINSDSRSHTVGSLAFAPDGSLYVSLGDGASFNQTDPRAFRVQDPNSLAGKVLRIDPETGRGLSDNPFYNGNPDDNRSKVYQLGLRNPWRLTVNDETGQLFIGETGLTSFEEINSGGAGANFGWPAYEGGQGINRRTPSYQNLGLSQTIYNSVQATPALIALQHGTGFNVIVAGEVGHDLNYGAQYDGDLFYNDLNRGILRHADIGDDGSLQGVGVFATDAQFVVDIEQGNDGLLYYVNLVEGTIGRWEIV